MPLQANELEANELDDVPFTEAELSQLKGLNSDFWSGEDFSQHALFRDELPSNIEDDATLTALQLLSDEKLVSGAEQLKHWRDVGNQLYSDAVAFEKLENLDLKKRRLRDAISAYAKALQAECDTMPELRSVIHANRALCFFKLGEYAECVDDAKYAIVRNPQNIKAYFHAARGSLALSLHKRALSFIDEAYRLIPAEKCADLEPIRKQLVEILDSRKMATERRIKAEKRSAEVLSKVLQARNINWVEKSPYNAPLGKPQITESNLVAWPILFLIEDIGVSEGIDGVEESVTIDSLLEGFFAQDFGWNRTGSYTPSNVSVSVWRGGSDEDYVELPDHKLALYAVVEQCKKIHQFLVMKLVKKTF